MQENQIGNTQKNYLTPVYSHVEASCLMESISVYEETPGIHQCLPDKDYAGHVIYVTDRETEWANKFM